MQAEKLIYKIRTANWDLRRFELIKDMKISIRQMRKSIKWKLKPITSPPT